jgi:signal transduction histidine kinase
MLEKRRSALRYAVAIGSVAAAIVFKSLPLPIGPERPFLLLAGAVVLAAWYGGRGPALLAFALSVLAADYFLPPEESFALNKAHRVQLALFTFEAAVLSALTIATREARVRAEASALQSKRAEEQLRRLNRILHALSTCNQILIRSDREEQLLHEICQSIVEIAGYCMCWVGYVEHDEAKTVRPVAQAGDTDDYLKSLNLTWADAELGRGPAGTAIRTGEPCVQSVHAPTFAPWRVEATMRGFTSTIALPLRDDEQVFGALMIYTSKEDAFNDDAVQLLSELANDIGYGIVTLRARRAVDEARAAVEQANRANEEFLRIAAHELRTPLTPILGWAQILEKSPQLDHAQLERGLDVILRSVRREAQLVDDLIDVSHMVAGKMSTEMRQIELGPIVEACVEEARAVAEAKGVTLTAAITKDTSLAGDARRLRQVTRNLLSNALKFTPRGGRVSVEVTRERDALVLRVRDTGKGLSAGELPRMFEPFHQGDPSMTRTEGGLGLGLAIVRYIIEAHGGTVRAESAGPGRGTTFIAELRASPRERVDGAERARSLTQLPQP